MKNFGLAAATVGVIAGIATPVLADEIKVAHITPEASAISQADLAFANELAEKSQGEHKFTFFWSGSLGAGNEIIPLIKGGAIRAGVTAPAYYPSDMPLSGVTNTVPALFPDAGVAMDVSTELRENAAVVAEFERNGVFPIVVQALPTAHLQCRDKVETLEDLKGKKVRSYGSFLPVMFESIGMVPVNMGLNEIYEGIERGVIDCTSFGYDLAKSYNIHEVAPFYSDIALGAQSGPVFYASWSDYRSGGWSDAFKAVVDEVAAKHLELRKENAAKSEEAALAFVQEKGVTLVPFQDQAKVDELIPDMLALWAETQKKAGIPAEAVDSVVAIVKAKTN